MGWHMLARKGVDFDGAGKKAANMSKEHSKLLVPPSTMKFLKVFEAGHVLWTQEIRATE